MTIEQLTQLYQEARDRRAAAEERVKAAIRAANEASEDADGEALAAELVAATEAHDDAAAEEGRCARNLEARKKADEIVGRAASAGIVLAPAGSVQSGREERTYRSFGEYARDAYAASMLGDGRAGERVERARREALAEYRARTGRGVGVDPTQRDVDTTNFAGLTVPQYLTDAYAPAASSGRPVANICRKHDLPASGMTVEISRATTATDATIQVAQNDVANETGFDDTQLSVPVRTISGMQDVSRQAVERSSGAVDVVWDDLFRRYGARLNNQIVNGSGASGQILGIRSTVGINAVTYTDATPTMAELQLKMLDASQQIDAALLDQAGEGPSFALMAIRRWAWMLGQSDTAGRPLVTPMQGNPLNQSGGVSTLGFGGPVGWIHPGLIVVADATIPLNLGAGTNQDQIIVTKASELHLWEDPAAPFRLAFEHPEGRLAVRVIVYGFAAFTAGRYPAASSTIDGTGLIAPTF